MFDDENSRDSPLRTLYFGMGALGHVAVHAAITTVLRKTGDRTVVSSMLHEILLALRDIHDFDPEEYKTLRSILFRRIEESFEPEHMVRLMEQLPDITPDERIALEQTKLWCRRKKVA